jgi:hypothetical protein
MKRIAPFAALALLALWSGARAEENRTPPTLPNHEVDIGGSLLFTPYGGSIGPSVSARLGNGLLRGGFSGNLGIVIGPGAGAGLLTLQPDLYIGPRRLSLHLATMGAMVFGLGKGFETLIVAAGVESEVTDHVRLRADVYYPPFLLRNHQDARLIVPAFGARILMPNKTMFVDIQLIVTQAPMLPVIPTFSFGVRI